MARALTVRAAVAPDRQPWRLIAWAYPTLLVTFATGGRPYYPAGILLALSAAGAVVTQTWLGTGACRLALTTALLLGAAFSALIFFPIIPARALAKTRIPSVNSDRMETIGWPQLARTVGSVYESLPRAERRFTIVLTDNYGEAGAIDHYAPKLALPRAYSGHNGYGLWSAPLNRREPAIAVGVSRPWLPPSLLRRCRLAARVDNGYAIDNDEQGAPVWICRGQRGPWGRLWPRLRHLS